MTCLGVRDDFLLPLLVCCATTILGDFRLKFWLERLVISSVILTANIGWWMNNYGGVELWNCLIFFWKIYSFQFMLHLTSLFKCILERYYPWKWETGGTNMGKFEFNWKWNRWPQQPQRAGEESTEGSSDQFAVCFFGGDGWWIVKPNKFSAFCCSKRWITSSILFHLR